MSYISIDSYGSCLNNIKLSNIKKRKQSNSILYSSYKFVIAIENSNCEDYVTEKLIDAFSSTSIPIVASRNGKPDYTRFAPKYSYINAYDYKSVKELADYLNYLSNNETAYNEYLWFRQLPANKYAVYYKQMFSSRVLLVKGRRMEIRYLRWQIFYKSRMLGSYRLYCDPYLTVNYNRFLLF